MHWNTTLQCFLENRTELQWPDIHWTALLGTSLHFTSLHCNEFPCTSLHCTKLHCTALQYTALHCPALHCSAVHCSALHYTLGNMKKGVHLRSQDPDRTEYIHESANITQYIKLMQNLRWCWLYKLPHVCCSVIKLVFLWLFRCNLLRCASLEVHISLTHWLTH